MPEVDFLNNSDRPEYIICAAIHFDDLTEHQHQPNNIKTGFVVCGRRHHNCIATVSLLHPYIKNMSARMNELNGKAIQGFLTSKNRFVDRAEAGVIAFKEKQINSETNCLFSEDLY